MVLDQVTKAAVSRALHLGQSLPIFPGIFRLTLVHNTGAAFGLFKNGTLILIFVSLFSIAILPWWGRQLGLSQRSAPMALAWIIGGALGNLIDRLRFGYVVDFLDFRVWPVFNLADSAIVLGAGWIAWRVWRSPRQGAA